MVTAEFAKPAQEGGTVFLHGMLELGLRTAMVLVFVLALVLLRRRSNLCRLRIAPDSDAAAPRYRSACRQRDAASR